MSGPRYSIFPADCLSDPRCKDVHLRVLATIGTHTDDRGWCEVNQRKLGERCGKSRETINRAIRDLCEMGYLSKRDRVTKAGGRTISQYRVLMDRPDETQDVAGVVTSESHGVVTSKDHSPCDVAASQLNDPSLNDPSSLRSESARDPFDDFESAYPKPLGADRPKARREFRKLSAGEQALAISGARHLAVNREAERAARNETVEQSQRFTPNASRWLVERAWEAFDGKPPDPLVVVRPDQPEWALVEELRGQKLFVGSRGTATVRQSEIDAARAAERQIA